VARWGDMTENEKLDMLKKDTERLFDITNDLTEAVKNLAHRLDGVFSLASEAAKKVEHLPPRR
jgi:hypothetical protein